MDFRVDGSQFLADAQIANELMKRTKKLMKKRGKRSFAEIAAEKAEEAAEAKLKAANQASTVQEAPGKGGNNERIKLADLFSRIDQLNQQSNSDKQADAKTAQVSELTVEHRSTEVEISVNINKPVIGLERVNKNIAQTDRYLFEFRDAATFTIKDKWSGKSTTIWGDPHVDVDDVDGNNNGDFKDLQSSERYTTFMLQDGTRVTFTALDSGIIEKVDIFKDSQHLQGTGGASEDWEKKQLFSDEVKNGDGYESSLQRGDVVKAGGDGNDWFNAADQLVWGKTTGPTIYSRPTMALEIKVKQTIEQLSFTQQVDRLV
jgi:hypothetical protein